MRIQLLVLKNTGAPMRLGLFHYRLYNALLSPSLFLTLTQRLTYDLGLLLHRSSSISVHDT
jgi:hypothetical protein